MTGGAAGSQVAIQYDGWGNRVAETANGVTTQYLVDDLNPTGYSQVVEEIVNGSVQRQYSYGLQRIDENQIVNNAWTPSFYGYDGGGSVRQLTNLAGVVTDTYSYDAFGNLLSSTGTTSNHYLYRGEQYDQALNLYYLRSRFYDPVTARFLSRDPFVGFVDAPRTLHKYLYVGGEPINWRDPTGWNAEEDSALTKEVSEGATEGEKQLARRVSCVLDTAADLLNVVTARDALGTALSVGTLAVDLANCAAKGKKSLPKKSSPNSTIEGPRRTREYGPNGEPFRDYDKPHQGAQYYHVHDWPDGVREEPGRQYSPWPRGRNPL